MANEEIKENVPPEEYVDPDAARAEDEDEAEPAPAGPAPIIKKKKLDADHAGEHGGAWKIALADMMTAMMAFFLLMWLLGATNDS
jgi:chemotaxis protein MotB